MYEIMVLNPRPGTKRKARKAVRRRRTKGVKVMAKRRKLSAKQIAAGFGGKRRRSKRRVSRKRSRIVARRRRPSGKRRPAMGYVSGSRRIRRRKLNPRSYRRTRRHRNPRFSVSGITSQLMPAVYGAGGALALDVAMGYIPVPAMLATGYPRHATRIVGALGIGWLGRKFLGAKGHEMGKGALVVAMYGLLKDVVVQFAPSVKGLGDYEEVSIDDTASQLGAYLPGSPLGMYLPDGSSAPGMGAYLGGGSRAFDASTYDVDDTAGVNMSGMDY